jgi:hypothetical protein
LLALARVCFGYSVIFLEFCAVNIGFRPGGAFLLRVRKAFFTTEGIEEVNFPRSGKKAAGESCFFNGWVS